MKKFAYITSIQRHNAKIERIWFQWAYSAQLEPQLHSVAMPMGGNSQRVVEEQGYILVSSREELIERAVQAAEQAEEARKTNARVAKARLENTPPEMKKYLRFQYNQEKLFDGVRFKSRTDILEFPIYYRTASDKYLCAQCASKVCREDEVIGAIVLERDHTGRSLVCDRCNPYLASTLLQIKVEGKRIHEGMVLISKSTGESGIIIEISDNGFIMLDTGHFGYGRSHRGFHIEGSPYSKGIDNYSLSE